MLFRLNYNETKKLVIISIICVFLLAITLAPSVIARNFYSSEEALENTVTTLNDDWDIIVPDDYPKIYEAIEHANPGNRIFVRSGTYNEHHWKGIWTSGIVIDKDNITLQGENKHTTIVHAGKYHTSIIIDGDQATVSGFTICFGINGSGIFIRSDKNIICHNIIHSYIDSYRENAYQYGIELWGSSGNTISDNIIIGNDRGRYDYGIRLMGSNNNTIQNNTITENQDAGVYLDIIYGIAFDIFGKRIYRFREPSHNNTILDNNISKNGIGIDVRSSDNIILNNTIQNNGKGVKLSSTNNTVSKNHFINDGIYIPGVSFNQEIDNNTVNDKPLYYYKNRVSFSVSTDAGQIILFNCNNAIIEKCNINHTDIAIIVGYSNNITIKNNIISYNGNGILLTNSNNNKIFENHIFNNFRYALSLQYSSNNKIYCNNFIKNRPNAIFSSKTCNNIWDENYWSLPRLLPKRSENYRIFPRILPKPILGGALLFPRLNFDWRPAKEPYDL